MTTANVASIMTASEGLSAKNTAKSNMDIVTSFQTVMSQAGNQENCSMKEQSKIVSNTKRQDAAEKKVYTDKKEQQPVNDVQKQTSNADKVNDKKTLKDADEVAQTVEKVVGDVKEEIKKALGISEEELQDIMAILGLSNMDLLDNQKVLQIVMQNTGVADKMELFGTQELVDTVKGVMESLQEEKEGQEGVDLQLLQNAAQRPEELLSEQQNVMAEEGKDDASLDVTANKQTQTTQDISESDAGMTKQSQQEGFGQQNHASNDNAMPQNVVGNQTVYHNLTQAVANSQQISYTDQAQAVDIVNQIVDEIRTVAKANTTQMEIQLNPENLGKVNITVSSREGLISAQITAQNEIAKNAIESQITVLKEAFQNQGLKVEAVEVTINPQGFDTKDQESFQGQQESKKSKKQINLESLDLVEEEFTEAETIAIDMMQRNGNSIDFSA